VLRVTDALATACCVVALFILWAVVMAASMIADRK
jgi:hypothetical protein